jgi:hypothetical protein
MRVALKRCTEAVHSSSHELIVRSALERYTTRSVPADRRTAHAGLPCSLLTPRGTGLSPCTERHSAGPHQAASSRATLAGYWLEEPLKQLSWASSPRHRWRSRRSVTRRVVARLSPSRSCRTFVARQRGASRQAASQWRGSGDHTPGRSLCDCAGGAGVVKKMPPRRSLPSFRFAGCGARIDAIELNHMLRSHTA